MTPEGMIRIGVVGAAGTALGGTIPVLALCCATPAAALALGAGAGVVGAAVWLEWLWLLVLPLLGFVALLAYGLYRQGHATAATAAACCGPEHGGSTAALPNAS